MRKRVTLGLIAILAVAAIATLYLRFHRPPRSARLLPEADAIVYLNVAPIRSTTHFDLDTITRSPDFQQFISGTGIVPERDVDDAAFALHAMPDPRGPNGLVAYSEVFTLRFDATRIARYLTSLATSQESYAGHVIYGIPVEGRTLRVTQIDKTTIAASNCPTPEQIHAILDHSRSSFTSGPTLLGSRYRDVPALSVAWAIGRIGLPFGSERDPHGRITVMGLELPLAVDTPFVASLRFTTQLHVSIEQIASSAGEAQQSAQALDGLLNVLRMLIPMPARTDQDKAFRDLIATVHITQSRDRTALIADPPTDLLKRLARSAAPATPAEPTPQLPLPMKSDPTKKRRAPRP